MGADGMANMSPNVIRLRAKNREDVPFMAFFLVSDFGQKLIKRETSGTGQPTITADLIEKIRIVKVSEEEKRNFEIDFHCYFRLIDESSFLVLKAQKLLESELGLDKLTLQKPLSYTARFSDIETSRRFDPEHYYPAFEAFANSLPPGISLSPLNRHLTFCQRGQQPIYSATGLRVINSKHVQPNRVLLEDNRFAAANPDGNLQIRAGDTLLNGTGRGTLGRAAPYLVEEPAVPDNHVTILRSDDLDPVYLSLYLNSAAGQMQVEMRQRGSSGQLELYPFDIRKFLVWPAPESLQQELRRLHDQAAAAERESRQLLEQAKSRVEQLIEEAART
jgi:type I restriction enzyme M protein